MHFVPAALAVLALALPTLCAPTGLIRIENANGPASGKHIVTLKQGVDKAGLISQVADKSTCNVTDTWDIINGFSGYFDDSTLAFFNAHSDVAYIDEDSIISIDAITTQTNAPWGLERISQPYPLNTTDTSELSYHYKYDDSAGAGVDIYIVDTGIYTKHSAFQGRATWGATFGGYEKEDKNGHGTHVAGTAAGYEFGVAKAASLIAVKVVGDDGRGIASDLISGLNWIRSQVTSTGRPSVASISLGGRAAKSVDAAVSALTKSGIHTVVAAGNSNTFASTNSPARAPSAISVGAVDITDTRAKFSNYGKSVKVFAPGVRVISAWIGSPFAINHLSGTSMATPHVSGIVAYLIGLHGNVFPATMVTLIQNLAVKGILKHIPVKTANLMAQN